MQNFNSTIMKTLKEFAASRLSKKQMSSLRGGAVHSDLCYPGELLYTCTVTYPNGEKTTGVVCAGDSKNAIRKVSQSSAGVWLDAPVSNDMISCR